MTVDSIEVSHLHDDQLTVAAAGCVRACVMATDVVLE